MGRSLKVMHSLYSETIKWVEEYSLPEKDLKYNQRNTKYKSWRKSKERNWQVQCSSRGEQRRAC